MVPVHPTNDSPDPALTLSWRCCCLEDFYHQFAQSPAASAGTTLPDESPSPGGSDAPESSSNSEDDLPVESSTEEEEEEEEPLVGAGHMWRQQFYPQSLTHNQGSITYTFPTKSPVEMRAVPCAVLQPVKRYLCSWERVSFRESTTRHACGQSEYAPLLAACWWRNQPLPSGTDSRVSPHEAALSYGALGLLVLLV